MKYFIDPHNSLLTKNTLKTFGKHPLTGRLEEVLGQASSLKNLKDYQDMVKKIVKVTKSQRLPQTKIAIHPQEIPAIKKHKPLTEPTMWGGVCLKKVDVEKDFIQKLLVINKFGVLGFEIHKRKVETLRVLEGYCLVFYSNHDEKGWKKGQITVKLGTVGDKFHFETYDEHGIIALTDCTIEETSTNHLDDLFFIYKLSQV